MSSLSAVKTQMLANFSLPSASPLSLQPRWLTLGGRGLPGSASGRAFLSGCSPSLCYHSSLPISRLDYCSCRRLLRFLNGDVQKLSEQNFSLKRLLLLLPPVDLCYLFSTSYVQSRPLLTAAMCHLLAPGPLWTIKKHAGSMLAGSYGVQN